MKKIEKHYILVTLIAFFSLLLEQGAPHFQFSLGPANYAVSSEYNGNMELALSEMNKIDI